MPLSCNACRQKFSHQVLSINTHKIGESFDVLHKFEYPHPQSNIVLKRKKREIIDCARISQDSFTKVERKGNDIKNNKKN